MEERRKFQRFPTKLDARYVINGQDEWKDCKVIEISREGTRIELRIMEKINLGSRIRLEIDVPTRTDIVTSTVVLLWIQELDERIEYKFLAGGKIESISPADKWSLLDYAYDNWKKNVQELKKHLGSKTRP